MGSFLIHYWGLQRHGCGGALLNGQVYVVGGSYAAKAEADQSTWKDSTEVFDLKTSTWRQVPPPSADKVFPAVGTVGGRIVVAGGETATRAAPGAGRKVEAFNPASEKWEDCPPVRDSITSSLSFALAHQAEMLQNYPSVWCQFWYSTACCCAD